VVVTVYIVLILLTLSLVYAGARLATLLPTYVPKIQANLADVGAWLQERGIGDEQVSEAIDALDANQLLSVATNLAGAIVALLSNLFFLVTLALFMAFDTRSTERGFAAVRAKRPHLVDALVSFTNGTRSYMAVSAGFGLIVAVIDGVALWIIGVPGAFVWAVLAFVTNFIPNIGFVIGVIPPAVIGLLEGGPSMMIGVIIVYSVINVVIQSVIQPRYVGDKVGLSPTITMLSLVFWAWALGALGALLAVPLSLLARALLVEADPDARWTLPLIAGKPDFRVETDDSRVEAEPAG
jgi:predicted PurR-regulated permease PerM